ncbi:FAD-binding oxidoreductase [Novosphingobium sp. PC22D]|uniref:FAD-binding oxidoreductase n=1 Tax=Novosphingobium sp. PC22D TaxID=1962403 RepID=UPI0011452E1F|nr:FAD-binding oxidoreductase [Novosphingobium sp. PC22D]
MAAAAPLPAALADLPSRLPEQDARFYASDVYRSFATPGAVFRPTSTDELTRIVTAAASAGLAIHVRGGGVSYTDAHVPKSAQSIVIDSSGMNRILRIDRKDMTATVEPGVTWEQLHRELEPHGLKVPFVGTFSGLAASVGGTLSQNANGHGSNANGISAESVVALDILTPDGRIVRTGTTGDASEGGRFRNFGPDLAGLFLGDSGALGIKTAITLKLLERKPARETASFAFPGFAALHRCMSSVAAMKIEEKSFGLDLALSQGQIAKQDTGTMMAVAKGVWRSSPNAVAGLRSLVRMAAAGKRVLASAPYAAHFIADGHTQVEARAKIDAIRKVALDLGREIANSVPTVVAAIPFQPLHNMLGPAGERWVPLHGLIPHSRVEAFHAAFIGYVEAKRAEMERKSVTIGAMFSSIGAGIFLYEPALYWTDTLDEYHERMMDKDYLAGLPRYPANPQGAALVEEMRTHIIDLMHAHGAAHFQVGKLYPYTRGRDPGALGLLRAIKAELDPNNLLNPGALGI